MESEKIKACIKKYLEKNKNMVLYIIVFFVVAIFFLIFPEGSVHLEDEYGLDDQRSTLWPLLISLIITMLGSLITTYVFLKEALDRMIDEKPYYRNVVKKYREDTMKFLWYYSLVCFALVLIIVGIYGVLYFEKIRTPDWVRLIICCMYSVVFLRSAELLYICIHIDKGIHRAAQESRTYLEEEIKQRRKDELAKDKNDFLKQFIAEFCKGKSLPEWLQITETNFGHRENLVNRFSEWEKFLLLLVDRTQGFISEQSTEQNIRVTLMHGEPVYNSDTETRDAKGNHWDEGAFRLLERINRILPEKGWKSFSEYYDILSEYRDLLQVERETGGKNKNQIDEMQYLDVFNEGDEITETFAEFLLFLFLRYLKMIPRIVLFFPTGKFQYVDFYNVRIEDSSFRSSLFESVIFARTKMKNSNLGVSKFANVEFYSADIRDCSWNNCLFLECNLASSIWNNDDLTGSNFENVIIRNATFDNVILSNVEFRETEIKNTLFVNSKLWDVELYNIKGNSLHSCSFADSDLKNIKVWAPKVFCRCLDEETFHIGVIHELDKAYDLKDWKKFDSFSKKWFSFKGNPFGKLKVFKNSSGRNQYEEWDVWKQIQELSFFNITETVFTRTKLQEIPFYRTDFSQSIFNYAQMNEGTLTACNLAGCVMEQISLIGAKLRGVYMGSTVLKKGVFFHADCSLVNFQDSNLISLHASEANLEYCTFERSDCSQIDLTKAVVKYSSFRDGILNQAELTSSEFEDVILDNCIADSMLSSYTRFYQCTFYNAFLKLSSFNYTVFDECVFELANFSESTVTGAEFYRCNFMEANFRNTVFINVIFKDNLNMKEEIFEGCTFMDVVFEGRDKKWEKIFGKNNTIKMRSSVQKQEQGFFMRESGLIRLMQLFSK